MHLVLFCAMALPAFARSPSIKPPRDSVALVVEDVTPTADDRHMLLLLHPTKAEVVPVQIGESEAITIAYRLGDRTPDRPLTHDLLDRVIQELDAEVVQIYVHTLRDGQFHARITLRQNRRRRALIHLDARAADAAAVAIGHGLPVYMADAVFEQAGISIDDMIESLTAEQRR